VCREEACRDEACRDEVGREEACRDEVGREEACWDEVGREEACSDEVCREEACRGESYLHSGECILEDAGGSSSCQLHTQHVSNPLIIYRFHVLFTCTAISNERKQ
jgi:hypothetical protein